MHFTKNTMCIFQYIIPIISVIWFSTLLCRVKVPLENQIDMNDYAYSSWNENESGIVSQALPCVLFQWIHWAQYQIHIYQQMNIHHHQDQCQYKVHHQPRVNNVHVVSHTLETQS